MQQLNIQEERHLDEPEEDIPSVVIPNHLQVQNADCSHLSFGSFGATMNPGFAGSFASRQIGNRTEETSAEPDTSSVGPTETRYILNIILELSRWAGGSGNRFKHIC